MEEEKEIQSEEITKNENEKSAEDILVDYNNLQNKFAELSKERAIEVLLLQSGARNLTAAKALIDKNKVTFDEFGKVFGLEEQIDYLKNSDNSSFLFKNPSNLEIVGAEVTENLCGSEFYSNSFSEINLTKQGNLLKNNPSLAQKITKSLFGK